MQAMLSEGLNHYYVHVSINSNLVCLIINTLIVIYRHYMNANIQKSLHSLTRGSMQAS